MRRIIGILLIFASVVLLVLPTAVVLLPLVARYCTVGLSADEAGLA